MGTSNQHDAYRIAFEQAQSLFQQMTIDLDALDHRHAALLSATKALETILTQRATAQVQSAQNPSNVIAVARPVTEPSLAVSHPVVELTQTYEHRELPNAIQRRIELALGQK